MIELPEPSAHMYPSDLEKFETSETFAHAYSVKVGCPGETSTGLYTADQLRTYGDQRAAEAREQMREQCISVCNRNAKSSKKSGELWGMEMADAISDEIKELK